MSPIWCILVDNDHQIGVLGDHQIGITRFESPDRSHQIGITRSESPDWNHQIGITRSESPDRNHQDHQIGITRKKLVPAIGCDPPSTRVGTRLHRSMQPWSFGQTQRTNTESNMKTISKKEN